MPDTNSTGHQQRLDILDSAQPLGEDFGSDEMVLAADQGLSVKRLEAFLEEIAQQPPWRRQADKEADYYDGNQLTAEQISELEERGFAPIITNLIQPTINVVLGMEAKTRSDWVVRAENGEISDDMAQALSAKLHKAEVESRADRALSDAYADQVKVGLGWVEVARSSDPFSCGYRVRKVHRREISFDWRATEPDLGDARYLVRSRWLDEDTAVAAFPEHQKLIGNVLNSWGSWDAVASMETGAGLDLNRALDVERGFSIEQSAWLNPVRKRVLAYEVWYRVIVKGHTLRLPNGRRVEFDLEDEDHVAAVYAGQLEPIPSIFKKVRLAWWLGPHRISDEPSPYNHHNFPYVPLWGFREDRTGAPYGLIRSMISPADEVNARRSKMLWLLNSKRVIADGDAVLDHQKASEEIGRPDAYVILNPARQRDARFDVQDGGQLAAQQFQVLEAAKQEINQASGIYQSMLGQSTQASSGLAINSLIEQGSTTLAEINDNYRFARRLVGEMLLELVREDLEEELDHAVTVGDPGEERTVMLNQQSTDELGRPALENDVSQARVSVVLDDVPTSPTFRMQQLQMLTEMLKASPPQVQAVLYDMVVESMDLPKKADVLKRIRSAMGVGQDGAPPDPEKMQMGQHIQQQDQLIQQGMDELKKLTEENSIARIKLVNKDEELILKARELAIKEADVAIKAQGQLVDHNFRVEEAQAAQDIADSAGATESNTPAVGSADIQSAVSQAVQEALAPLLAQLAQLVPQSNIQGASDGNS